ncbi:MAG: hypothetical protein IKG57_06305 [Enterococcus sp.]|uniref:hypothetical protein n=1 Tax=Enterococcus sp. TaxID=35783 RepID=UPI00257C86ED|nr:hypothetical protein [Enterococcus sp.]MBR2525366.1 hypothetical protein [bacterium]MBR3047772.1 hypothetical protein [Enterococcus sp.]
MADSKPKQPYSEAKKRANQKWDSANLDRISVVIPKGEKTDIKNHADSRGESLNGFVVRAIHETMERDTQ